MQHLGTPWSAIKTNLYANAVQVAATKDKVKDAACCGSVSGSGGGSWWWKIHSAGTTRQPHTMPPSQTVENSSINSGKF